VISKAFTAQAETILLSPEQRPALGWSGTAI